MYNGVGGWEGGGVGGGGGWEAGGGLYRPTGLFGVAMSPRSASHRPRHDWRALRDVSPTQGWISDPYLPSSALHGSHCLSRDFTRSAKPCLEKQTSQLSPLMQQWTGSVWVWLLAGLIKAIGQMCVHGRFSNIQSHIVICDRIWENRPMCHNWHFEKYRFNLLKPPWFSRARL